MAAGPVAVSGNLNGVCRCELERPSLQDSTGSVVEMFCAGESRPEFTRGDDGSRGDGEGEASGIVGVK